MRSNDDLPSVSCICLTYDRPYLLQQALDDFLLQDYPGEAELLIFNTCPLQELKFDHPMVKVVNWRPRPRTLGACRNLALGHTSNDYIITWDDDDSYRYDHVSSLIQDMGDEACVRVNGFFSDSGKGPPHYNKRGPLSQVVVARRLLKKVGGYPELDTGEDRDVLTKLQRLTNVKEVFRTKEQSTLTYNNHNSIPHVSWNSDYKTMGKRPVSDRGVIDLGSAFKPGTDPVVNIITNIDNGAGLQRHALTLAARLKEFGMTPRLQHFQRPGTWKEADLNIHVEVLEGGSFNLAPQNWFMPMPEWYFEDRWRHLLDRIDQIVCNTRHAVELFQPRHHNVKFLGFESRDMYRPDVERSADPRFLHVAGLSTNKNTLSVLQTWDQFKIEAPLTILGSERALGAEYERALPPNVDLIRRVSDEELATLLNQHPFHICVSRYEGWGHYLHEAHSTGGVTITHDQPPLADFHATFRCRAEQTGKLRIAPVFAPSNESIHEAVQRCLRMSSKQLAAAGHNSRAAFLNERNSFISNFHQLCETLYR